MSPQKRTGTYVAVGLGLLGIGGGAYLLLRKVPKGIKKSPGDVIGAKITFRHRGPASRPWIGFALSPHRDRGDIQSWIGGYFDVPTEVDWKEDEVEVEGASPSELPERDQMYECLAFIGDSPGGDECDSKWYDDIYDFDYVEKRPWWKPFWW